MLKLFRRKRVNQSKKTALMDRTRRKCCGQPVKLYVNVDSLQPMLKGGKYIGRCETHGDVDSVLREDDGAVVCVRRL